MKKWRIKRIDELNDDELDEFYCTRLNHDNVSNVLCTAGPSVKYKLSALSLYLCQVETLILKNQLNATKRYSHNRTFAPIISHWSKTAHSVVCKLTVVVSKTFEDFVEMTLPCLKSFIEHRFFRESSHLKSWFESELFT